MALAITLSGCARSGKTNLGQINLGTNLPVILHAVKTTKAKGKINPKEAEINRKTTFEFIAAFHNLYPNVQFHLSFYPEDQLAEHLRTRNQSGLGPDLIMTSGEQTNRLLKAGLISPMIKTKQQIENTYPDLLRRVTNRNGMLSGQPMGQETQLACFDKTRVVNPPETVQQLLQESSKGIRTGLVINLRDLYWSAGSLGAQSGLNVAFKGKQPDAEEKQGILSWLNWLKNANYQQQLSFVENQSILRNNLMNGELDWISCWSSQLRELRDSLGENLGISELPRGPKHSATAVTRLLVWSLGKNSSESQRQMTMKFIDFVMKPWAQKTYAMKSKTYSPVNPKVEVAVSNVIKRTKNNLDPEDRPKRLSLESNQILSRLSADPSAMKDAESIVTDVIYGVMEPEEADDHLIKTLQQSQ